MEPTPQESAPEPINMGYLSLPPLVTTEGSIEARLDIVEKMHSLLRTSTEGAEELDAKHGVAVFPKDLRALLDALADREAAIKEGLERADRVIKSALFSHEEKEIARNIAEALTGRRRRA